MDINELLARHESDESLELEFKSAAHGLPDSLWESVSAFANTAGGWLLLGVRQEKAKPAFISGNPYKGTFVRRNEGDYRGTKQKVDHMIRDAGAYHDIPLKKEKNLKENGRALNRKREEIISGIPSLYQTPKTSLELAITLKKSRVHLVHQGALAYANPDTPRASNQKYVVPKPKCGAA